MDISALSAPRNYAALRSATMPQKNDHATNEETPVSNLVNDFASTLKAGEDAASGAMLSDLDPHSLVQALSQSELAVETAIVVRDKVVQAYQEILRMPV